MCEQTEIDYLDGDVVWVKLGSCWWPGEVVGKEKLPPDVLPSFRKPPIACVKFFQEDAYEFVKNISNIYKYNCSRKNEFINKGLYLFRTRHGHMEKFPDDVLRAETAVGGDIEILTKDEFQETKKESYAGLFGNPKKTPSSVKKGKAGRGRPYESPTNTTPRRQMKEKTDYKVHILVQGSKPAPSDTSLPDAKPSTSSDDASASDDKPQEDSTGQEDKQSNENANNTDVQAAKNIPLPSTPLRSTPSMAPSSSGIYSCHACPFTTTRLNVLIMHNKNHSVSFVPYTPTPVKKKTKTPVKSTPTTSKTPKPRKPRKEKADKPPKKAQGKKRTSGDATTTTTVESKKPKTDEEIKSKLLADWDDDVDEDSNDESTRVSAQSPEVPVGAESPAVPTPAELPSAQVPAVMSPDKKSGSSPSTDKPESSDSKYEFCEDEDWPEETDFGRKIPRVKNPVRTDDAKNLAIDDDEVAREVTELLNKTSVPELPSVPEPLRIEENFPEPPIVKSPDKIQAKSPEKPVESPVSETPPTKAIFKTKTFFRSRHSRSQDVIGKYVAEQLNAVERMDISESDINGSETVSSPEGRDSPPIEPVKVAKLAPKIQLKKMKAEAAQLREKEKLANELAFEAHPYNQLTVAATEIVKKIPNLENNVKEEQAKELPVQQDVLYPTQEIKPLNQEFHKNYDEVLQDTLTHKDILMEEDISESVKDTLHDQDTVLKSKFEEEIPRVDVKTPNREEESTKYNENLTQCQETPAKIMENLTELEKEISNNGEVVIHSPVYEDEYLEYQKVASNQCEQIQTSTYENETSHEEKEVLSKDISTEHDRDSNKDKTSAAMKHCNKIDQDLNSEEQEVEEPPIHDKSIHEPSLLEKEELETQSINKKVKDPISKAQDQVGLYLNESTASAVDALLSVSRETDRVPRAVTNDLPEDLFEDDKDTDVIEPVLVANNELVESIQTQDSYLPENRVTENMETEEIQNHVEITPQMVEQSDTPEVFHSEEVCEEIVESTLQDDTSVDQEDNTADASVEIVPSESDLQVAEALINLPATAIQKPIPTELNDSMVTSFSFDHENNHEEIVPAPENDLINDTEITYQENEVETETVDHVPENAADADNLNARFETEQEKSENLNAAQSLVQMSESVEHSIGLTDPIEPQEVTEPSTFTSKPNNGIDTNSIEQTMALLTNDNSSATEIPKMIIANQSSSKLLKILEEPFVPKIISKSSPTNPILQGKEKILSFDVAKSTFNKKKSPKQKIIIRRNPVTNKTVLNKVTSVPASEKIILSRSGGVSTESSAVQRYTIQTAAAAPSDAGTILIQQKVRKLTKPAIIQPKLQKIKPQTSLVAPVTECKTGNKTQPHEEAMFDINSMPIVLSEDLLTPESIEKMPVVMSDGNMIGQSQSAPKVMKPKQNVHEQEKVVITSAPHKQQELKTLLLNPAVEAPKSATPNILSKSAKMRGAKPMLVFDKATGKQRIIMTKPAEAVPKEIKQPQPAPLQPAGGAPKTEKFIILPSASPAPRAPPTRTQKIVIDPQTGKAHMFVAKGPEAPAAADNKAVAAKMLAGADPAQGNTVMIITNAQGAQSRIVLTPRHEKILFPNKQQPAVPQLKAISHRFAPSAVVGPPRATLSAVGAARPALPASPRAPARIVSKQNKSAIITSKGQLIVGGRVATTAQNIAPMPELRPVQPKRIVTAEPKKTTHVVSKTTSEPIIFLQQKSGAMMQLTAAQFEHLQRTGQIMPKNSVSLQAAPRAKPAELAGKRGCKPNTSPTPAKKLKQEVVLTPAPAPPLLMPAPPPLITVQPGGALPPLVSVASSSAEDYSALDNFEELLPSTAIARQAEPAPEPAPAPAPEAPAAISDQILAVPGEHFGALAGTFYLCVEENGTYTPIDNRPLVLENDQLVPMETPPQPERRDILEAALANSDVFRAEAAREDAPDFRDLNANVSVHCRVAETSSLQQPIMTPAELPSSGERAPPAPSLEAGLAALGVLPAVPTSLELPITVTDPRIAPRAAPPISMPLLTDDEPEGKSMPLLSGPS